MDINDLPPPDPEAIVEIEANPHTGAPARHVRLADVANRRTWPAIQGAPPIEYVTADWDTDGVTDPEAEAIRAILKERRERPGRRPGTYGRRAT